MISNITIDELQSILNTQGLRIKIKTKYYSGKPVYSAVLYDKNGYKLVKHETNSLLESIVGALKEYKDLAWR